VGHANQGKSSTAGHLLFKCGYISRHDMDKIIAECAAEKMGRCAFSRVLDIYDEEKTKGNTHEYQLVEFTYKDKHYELIDTPGHKMFIRSMITGLYQKKPEDIIGCVMISVIKGEFEAGFGNGQTKEDIILLRAIGITKVIIIINKMDTVDFAQAPYDDTVAKLDKFVKKLRFANICYIPVSGFKGIGLVNMDDMPSWYKGKELIALLDDYAQIKDAIPATADSSEDLTIYRTKQLIVQFNILNSPLVTIGTVGMCHYPGGEIAYSITKILTINNKEYIQKTFAKSDDKITCIITLETDILIVKGTRILFRDKEQTVGFGKVLKVKPL